jgi:hypothetical protein
MKRENGSARTPVVVMLLYALGFTAGISFAGAGWYYKKQMYLQYQAEEQRFRTAANSYLAVDDEARLVREYFPYVIDLHEHGVLGPELRLDWIEVLQQADRRLGLPSLHYRIGAQAEYQPAHPFHNGSYRIYYSPMQIDIDLLHEGDLHAFFVELDRRGLGIYSVASCRLSRLHSEINHEAAEGNIRAECALFWFNIRKQDGGVVDLS